MDIDKLILEKQRRECWIKAYCAVANDSSCNDEKVAIKWANATVDGFDKKFNTKNKTNGSS